MARSHKLYMVTVPGLRVTSDFASVRDRLLDDCPGVLDVLPTTIKATRVNLDAWLERAGDEVVWRHRSAG